MNGHYEPPSTVQELDVLLHQIDLGDGYFASLSDDQRRELKEDLSETWVTEHLDEYPVPAQPQEAANEYREIQAGLKYPNLTAQVRTDLLIQFDDHYGEGGPDQWGPESMAQ